ncbi:MAG: amino acid ABC transporter ATP-binding protein [Firmicutes bacterium]|nr:amino acid ABC transporter ATP-binding protein [Bacillota bacterium]MDD4264061.1 amino acid ABC transporter ATP-binding protein [Bacillota bacterium]MDD4694418.1 amino acid ABC transporter ATP-binding protein [Bacillota bacterium]
MDVLRIDNIRKSFDALEVLQGISFSVTTGEVVAIIGPSGSGKSTLLRCATLLERMDSGELSFLNEKIAWTNDQGIVEYMSSNELKKVRSKIGLVFQNFNLFPHYSVLKNITDPPITVQKKNKQATLEDAYILLDKMGLRDKANAYPYQLSGGQQQRVSIARALALNPQILFFDEPTSALDPELTGEILKVIRDLAAEHMTMVIVTHEIEFARNVADRIIFMDEGLIVEEGRPDTLVNNPQNERTKAFLNRLQR